MRGRLVLTPQVVERAGELRDEGATVQEVADALGLSRRTTFRALARTPPEPLLPIGSNVPNEGPATEPATPPEPVQLPPGAASLLERPELEPALVAAIAKAGSRDWRAAAWILERRWPERWGRGERESVRPPFSSDPDDPLYEVDQLAERRRKRPRPPK